MKLIHQAKLVQMKSPSREEKFNNHIQNDGGYNDEIFELVEEYQVGDVVLSDMKGKKYILKLLERRYTDWRAEMMSGNFDTNFICASWTEKYFVKKFSKGEPIDHLQYKNPKYFTNNNNQMAPYTLYNSGNPMYYREYDTDLTVQMVREAANYLHKPSLRKKTMNKLSQLSAWAKRTFSPDQKALWQAGFINECGVPTEKGLEALKIINWEANEKTLVEKAKEELVEAEKEEKK